VLALLLSDVLVLHPFAGKNEVTSNASAFAFALFLTEGTTAAALGMALGSVVSDVLRKTPSRDQILFNAGQYVLAWGAAGLVFELLGGGTADGVSLLDADNITAAIASGAAFFIVNYALVGAAVALERGGELLVDVAAGWWPPSADEIASLSIGLLIASAGVSVATAPLLLLPFAAYLATRKTETERDEALRDPLTGLVARALFTDRAQQAMRHAERTGIGGAIPADRSRRLQAGQRHLRTSRRRRSPKRSRPTPHGNRPLHRHGRASELYPEVVDGPEDEGGVPSRLLKTEAGDRRQEGTPWRMFAGSLSGRTTRRSRSRSTISLARALGA